MKLVRFAVGERIAIGVWNEETSDVVDLALAAGEGGKERFPSSMTSFLQRGNTGLEDAASVAENATEAAVLKEGAYQLLCPIGDPGKIICVGQNYRDHCIEQNQPIPESAIIFSKYATALNNPNGQIHLPAVAKQVDYEAELVFVIGGAGGGRNIPEAEAMNHVGGYMCANDVSARDLQFADKQWVRGKTPDGFLPTGPYLATPDDIADPHNLDISLTLNGQTMQSSNTLNLIFQIPFLIAYLSQTMTLLPGDIISTGTPGGVGIFRNPQVLLKSGDVVSVTISGLGTLTNTVV